MKLASLKGEGRDGCLAVVSRDLTRARVVPEIARSLREAIEAWARVAPLLSKVAAQIEQDPLTASPLEWSQVGACLPRAFQFVDGSAYLAHVERVRRARGAEMPPSFRVDPLMYQAVSDRFLGPSEPIEIADEDYGVDLEAEVGVIVDDVPMGITPDRALTSIRLITLINDVSLRNLIPSELSKGFGFLQSKPLSALAGVAVTPDELGDDWRNGRVHRRLESAINGVKLGDPDAGCDMQFGFGELIAHAAKTRPLGAGTLAGSGTVANQDVSRGSSCLAERRVLEVLSSGKAETPFLRSGDRIRIDMTDRMGRSIFGAIEQTVVLRR
ncbi:fumarylacetoacetate hydrolase family protein [mine drainage metagenome]|uniref:Fumarylacetoacetate hydrolase family protein n=1 Tax=mine drainage metagenome TaxID=410659 RepID=T1A4G8_9ZZZZ